MLVSWAGWRKPFFPGSAPACLPATGRFHGIPPPTLQRFGALGGQPTVYRGYISQGSADRVCRSAAFPNMNTQKPRTPKRGPRYNASAAPRYDASHAWRRAAPRELITLSAVVCRLP
jgi:hypothetical protein